MVYGCGNKTVKLLLFLSNALIALAGLMVACVSVWAAINAPSLSDFLKSNNINVDHMAGLNDPGKYTTSFWVLAGAGVVLLLVGFLGCCGACCENNCLLGVYFVIILIVFIIQLAVTVLLIWKKDVVKDAFRKAMTEVENSAETKEDYLKIVEVKFKCCGISGATPRHTCNYDNIDIVIDKNLGCFDKMWDEMETSAGVYVVVVSVLVLIVEFLTMLFACLLFRAFNQSREYFYERATA